jgi:hypothetical protein
MFEIGKQCVCIKRDKRGWENQDGIFDPGPPYLNQVLTITDIKQVHDSVYLKFSEISRNSLFRVDHFRPCKDTSIKMFKEMLAPKKEKA